MLFALPTQIQAQTVATPTIEELRQQIADLTRILNHLLSNQSKQSNSSATISTTQGNMCNYARSITKTLAQGMVDPQVTILQKFLNLSGIPVAVSGQGSSGNETNYFGQGTKYAVQLWQTKNNVVSSGTPETTGYGVVGMRTRTAMQTVSCNTVPQNDNDIVCTTDARRCPDGSYVSRVAPTCEFAACPAIPTASITSNLTATVNKAKIISGTATNVNSVYMVITRPNGSVINTDIAVANGLWSYNYPASTFTVAGNYLITIRANTYNGTILTTGTLVVSSDDIVCTTDARRCPDGSYVSRVAPTCEFAACPAGSGSSGW